MFLYYRLPTNFLWKNISCVKKKHGEIRLAFIFLAIWWRRFHLWGIITVKYIVKKLLSYRCLLVLNFVFYDWHETCKLTFRKTSFFLHWRLWIWKALHGLKYLATSGSTKWLNSGFFNYPLCHGCIKSSTWTGSLDFQIFDWNWFIRKTSMTSSTILWRMPPVQ